MTETTETATAPRPQYPFSSRGDCLAPELDDLRGECPVVPALSNAGEDVWLVTGHAEARAVLTDSRVFDRAAVGLPDAPVQDTPIYAPEVMNTMGFLRRAGLADEVRRALGPEHPDLPEEWVRAVVRRELAAMLAGPQPGDLQHHLATRVSGEVMCRLLGIPLADLPRVAEFADGDVTMLVPAEQTARNWAGMQSHMAGLIAQVRDGTAASARIPADGLMQRLVARNDPDRGLTTGQLANIVGGLFVLGYEDMTSFLGVGAHNLLRRPWALEELRADPATADRHIEELLRLSVVLGNALARIVTTDTEIAGRRLRAGDMVLISTDAANHDPEVFPDPHRYDPGRSPNPHIRFGHGPHYCAGAHLARWVARIAFTELSHHRDLRLAVPPEQLEWRPNHMAITLAALPVRW
ncbi:cytochrome P450 [Streptomonospora nanhaiensis]|uniref:cytochrome P450 n=1 Tax=Streptomonospora nanhaiensis TaxID=1323731 RepID=UPI001C98FAC1|nr:cytochrome P450 [Streptomonospora nanhaiensis]MBX9391053.1 cytochrome P450 [Streptomonospora nanhaiensis]